jgi:WhiB family redox-sensing transcriptional regulator
MDRWQEAAACRDMDVEMFYPGSYDAPEVRAALAACDGCPVRERCLTEALDRGERYGIWGGTVPEQRQPLLGRRAS